MFEQFTDWLPQTRKTKALLAASQAVIEEFSAEDIALTVRQLYYQLVSRDIIPNNERAYKRLIELITKGRMGGHIDWSAIVDRGRVTEMPSHWDSPGDILRSAKESYRLDRWGNQPYFVEVWCEKDALSSILEPICNRWHVRYLAGHGYLSTTAVYDAAKRFDAEVAVGRTPVVVYIGDHDPSGHDMSRDISDRLFILTRGQDVEVNRLALTSEQVRQYDPPPNPTKVTDSRAADYIAEFGHDSWEVDALNPRVLEELVTDTIEDLLDFGPYEEILEREEEDREQIREAIDDMVRKRKQSDLEENIELEEDSE